MPTHKSSRKRILISKRQNERNRALRSRMNTAVKRVLEATSKAAAEAELKNAYSVVDKTVKAGIVHRNKGANQKAMLSRAVQRLGA